MTMSQNTIKLLISQVHKGILNEIVKGVHCFISYQYIQQKYIHTGTSNMLILYIADECTTSCPAI
jgi:hypothetical protein